MKKNKKEVISNNIKKNLLWNAFGSFTYLFCQWLLTLIVVRLSSDLHDPGNFALALTITNVFFNLACFNLRPFLVSDVDNEYEVNTYVTFRILICIISTILCLLYIVVLKYSMLQILTIILFMLFKIGEAITDVFHALEQKKDRMDIGGISLFVRGVLSLVSFYLGFKLFNNLPIAIIFMIASTCIFIILYDVPNIRKFENIKIIIDKEQLLKLFLCLLPLTVGTFLGVFTTSLPRQFLESIAGTDKLGIYATVATPAVIVQTAATYIYNPFLTVFSQLKANNDYKGFVRLFSKITVFIILLSIICFGGSIVFAEPVLKALYGSVIASHSDLFIWVIVLTSFTGYLWFCNSLLVIFRRIKSILVINVISFLISLSFSTLFINNFGMNGVSFILILVTIMMIIEMLSILYYELNKLRAKQKEKN